MFYCVWKLVQQPIRLWVLSPPPLRCYQVTQLCSFIFPQNSQARWVSTGAAFFLIVKCIHIQITDEYCSDINTLADEFISLMQLCHQASAIIRWKCHIWGVFCWCFRQKRGDGPESAVTSTTWCLPLVHRVPAPICDLQWYNPRMVSRDYIQEVSSTTLSVCAISSSRGSVEECHYRHTESRLRPCMHWLFWTICSVVVLCLGHTFTSLCLMKDVNIKSKTAK